MNKSQKIEGLRDRLRNAFIASGKTATQVRRETGISKSCFYQHLNGEGMGALHIARYAVALNVSADWLLGIKEAKR